MSIFLDKQLVFPDPSKAFENGFLAFGGDLSIERLLLAYRSGIFPWYSKGDPILWWSPNPRFVLYSNDLKVSKSMRQLLRRKTFRVSFDQAFEAVIDGCSQSRPQQGQDDTWITDEMRSAYVNLHEAGYAHSVEVWDEEELVGGLYGVGLGRIFFGESMFHRKSNASKFGFISLVQALEKQGFDLIDSQLHTNHLESLGAVHISRDLYLKEVRAALEFQTILGDWSFMLEEY